MSNYTNKTVEIKTSELIDEALDWAVAKALGYIDYPEDSIEHGEIWHTEPDKAPFGRIVEKKYFHPSTSFNQGGYIIFREGISWHCGNKSNWHAYAYGSFENISGPTPLIASMRCFVASKLGDTVEIPKDLFLGAV